jgi:tRNA(fMet)-specific endonuclease VapC
LATLLDTSAAILIRDDDPTAMLALAGLTSKAGISVVSKVELEGGVYARPELFGQRRQRLDVMLRRLDVFDFTSAMATIYGQIVARNVFSRRRIIDRMIAATALELGLSLITCNPNDFDDIDGLQLIVWQG